MSFRKARIAAGKTVREAMENFGVSDAMIYNWETGANFPKANRLLEIAAFYGCTVDELLRDEGNENDS